MLNVRSALEARFPEFFERHTRIGPVLLRFLGFLFHESRLQHFEQEHPHSRGFEHAKRQGVDGLICGHLHYPSMLHQDDVTYYNDGDWVENCTALVQDFDGEFHLLHLAFAAELHGGDVERRTQSAVTVGS